jgi:CRISPR/Cas system-associated exonuclease Cas4 (RecB family)
MSHFYDESGKLHDCDIREARKNGYVGSVTEIIHTFENSYGLDLYKAKQMFLASLTLPRPEGISDDKFFELVKKDSAEHSERAKQFGTNVHEIVNSILKNYELSWTAQPKEKNAATKIIDWIKTNTDSVIVDFKSQETKNGKFKQPYDSHLFQLCGYYLYFRDRMPYNGELVEHEFYAEQYGGKIDYAFLQGAIKSKLINLYISSNEDIPIKVYEWKPEKIEWGCQSFIKMVELYRILKKL